MSLDDLDKNRGGVHPDGLKLGFVSFLTDLVSKIILLFFAMFFTPIGGASAALLDIVEGLGDLSALSLNDFAGWLSDRTGKRKAFALAGYGFSTLAHNVFEGRHFCDNLRKGVKDYLAVKGGLIAIFLLPVLAGLPPPFSPIQIIVLVMFMDLAAYAGFVAEPSEADITRRRPRHTATALIEGAAVRNILLKGVLLFAAVIATLRVGTFAQTVAAGLANLRVRGVDGGARRSGVCLS